ncbi:Aste57867_8726 [Aphanomyces stellatus]|uniref:tRNA(His) guanylyltransferase n=1 Tax=Aphanomyces stellatus TaxID=120398 RepID=A0A485KL10_9STRA|nr:hypothetical protein As57867_008692 [Aphanomyces stellatus]VFT85612.1 Aste57867_8726 [Aphanomyces stellatus]
MANSRFEYVRHFELPDPVIRNTWLVVRVDGKGFHKFTDAHGYAKPNDARGLHLMNRCAKSVMAEFGDVVLAYGQSDEFSFVLSKHTNLYNRRATKLASTFVSLFTSSFVFYWPEYFDETQLKYPPAFDSRVVCYPSIQNVRDYMSWRHVDCHINNLYNTAFWALVQSGGHSTKEAERLLQQTDAKHKHELLFSEFGINYNDVSPMFKRGSTIVRSPEKTLGVMHVDLVKDSAFWATHVPPLVLTAADGV